jgi:Borrelia P83/100 protein
MRKPGSPGYLVFRLLFLTLAAASAWPQALSQAELITAAGRTFAFSTFRGKESATQSAQEIVGIGEVLWRTLRADGRRGDYFGKYEVIRALDPALKERLSADILCSVPERTWTR